MPDIYNLILKEAERRKISYVRNYFPFYISSIGCHIFNLMNQKKQIYLEGGSLPNTRLHTLFVTFPGFGKSFYLRQFLADERFSFIKGSNIKCIFEGSQTDAGFIGTAFRDEAGKAQITEGLCKQEASSIIGIEEFSAVTNSFKQTYNTGLDTSLLLALDSGDVVKRLGAGRVGYHTDMTLWAGVQPARYDLSSGFSRRFQFLTFYPTLKDIYRYRQSRREMKAVKVSKIHMKGIRQGIDQKMREMFQNLRRVYFSQAFYAELQKLDILHYEDELYERLALGYWLMKAPKISDQITINLDSELRRLIKLENEYKQQVRSTTATTIMWNLMKDEQEVKEYRIINMMMSMGVETGKIHSAINNNIIYKKIKKSGKNLINLKIK